MDVTKMEGVKTFQVLLFLIEVASYVLAQEPTSTPTPITTITNGKIEGKYLKVHVDQLPYTVAAYLGIPFAQPPLQDLRFSAPKKPLPWKSDVKLTQDFGPSCFHMDDTYFGKFEGSQMWNAPNLKSEDCLYLNVWTPISKSRGSANRLAVMVWIYGGSFFSGTTALSVYDGRYLAASRGVIVVSINYRLGPLGFLPPMGVGAPGNAGMLDQQMGLEWVRDNIRAFGGNPNSVTLFGESAGSVSVSLHALVPSSKGLFNRIIMQSGNALSPWASVSLETALNRTRQLAAALSCPDTETGKEESLLICLRSKTPLEIFQNSWLTTEIFDFAFVPVHETAFLPKSPDVLTKNGFHADIDILLGFNTNEGSYFTIYYLPGFNRTTESLINRDQYEDAIALCGLRTNPIGLAAAGFMYSDWVNVSNPAQYRDGVDAIIDNFHIRCPAIKMAKLHSLYYPNRKSFLYHVDYRISSNPWPKWMGVMHGYEIELVFGLPFFGNFTYAHNYNEADRKVSQRIMDYWTNFAKYGDPNGKQVSDGDYYETSRTELKEWKAYDTSHQYYMKISENDTEHEHQAPNAFLCAFWEVQMNIIQEATANKDITELKWKVAFARWKESMDSWTYAFSSRKNCET